ncbi:hypothetical protein BJ742DRAFT_790525 [Cladochytrium replicatum]|nr:hypothetical protein BJ742DRAFT_790525 [Cladochytrium replicatum]
MKSLLCLAILIFLTAAVEARRHTGADNRPRPLRPYHLRPPPTAHYYLSHAHSRYHHRPSVREDELSFSRHRTSLARSFHGHQIHGGLPARYHRPLNHHQSNPGWHERNSQLSVLHGQYWPGRVHASQLRTQGADGATPTSDRGSVTWRMFPAILSFKYGILLIGGLTTDQSTVDTSIYILNATTVGRQAVTSSLAPGSPYVGQSCVDDPGHSRIYCTGGWSSAANASASNELRILEYGNGNLPWKVSSVPLPALLRRGLHSSIILGQYLYLIGGVNCLSCAPRVALSLAQTQRIDLTAPSFNVTRIFTSATETAVQSLGAVFAGSCVVPTSSTSGLLIGGYDGQLPGTLNQNVLVQFRPDASDPSAVFTVPTTSGAGPAPNWGMGCAINKNFTKLAVSGGCQQGIGGSYILSLGPSSSMSWQAATGSGPSVRCGAAGTTYENYFIMAGGLINDPNGFARAQGSDMYFMSLASSSWADTEPTTLVQAQSISNQGSESTNPPPAPSNTVLASAPGSPSHTQGTVIALSVIFGVAALAIFGGLGFVLYKNVRNYGRSRYPKVPDHSMLLEADLPDEKYMYTGSIHSTDPSVTAGNMTTEGGTPDSYMVVGSSVITQNPQHMVVGSPVMTQGGQLVLVSDTGYVPVTGGMVLAAAPVMVQQQQQQQEATIPRQNTTRPVFTPPEPPKTPPPDSPTDYPPSAKLTVDEVWRTFSRARDSGAEGGYPRRAESIIGHPDFFNFEDAGANEGGAGSSSGGGQSGTSGREVESRKDTVASDSSTEADRRTLAATEDVVQFRVGIAHIPRMSDELELHVGDNVTVVKVYKDGWARGVNLRTGNTGAFPLFAVEFVGDK